MFHYRSLCRHDRTSLAVLRGRLATHTELMENAHPDATLRLQIAPPERP